MSERDYWDEESLKEYRADLIRQRNELNPITNRLHIKVLDEMIKNLPERYSDVQPCEENCKQQNGKPEKKPRTTFNEGKKSKNFFDNIGFWLLISPFIIIPIASVIFGIYYSFDNIVKFLTKIGSGYWLVGLIIVPFAIVAFIQMLRGAFLLLEVDADRFGLNEKKQDWKGSLYLVINFLGYAALYILLKKL